MTIRLRSRSRNRIAMALMILFMSSCMHNVNVPQDPDKDVAQVAKVLEVTANALTVYQRTIINANSTTPKLISDPAADQLVGISKDMNAAVQAASEATRRILHMTPAERKNIANLLDPVAKALDTTLKSPSLLNITNEQTRVMLQATLTSVQSTISSIQFVLAVRQ